MHLIACIADIHVGHPAAVWPSDYVTEEGNPILPNPAQKKILSYWNEFWNHPEVRQAPYILNLAESIEGPNPKEMGQGLMRADVADQTSAFVQLMAPHIKDKTYISVAGSNYHGLSGYSVEKIIADKLKVAEPSADVHFLGHITRWKHKPSGKYFVLTHKLGGQMLYKVTAMDRWSLYISAIKSKIGDPDAIISAHHHQYFAELTPSRLLVQLPAWKCWHPIKEASRYPFTQPTLGGVLLRIEDDGFISPRLFKYPLEHIYDAVVRL